MCYRRRPSAKRSARVRARTVSRCLAQCKGDDMGVIRVVLTDLDGVVRRWPATQFRATWA